MFASKITISKDTKKKNEMSVREKGKVLFARLQELEEDGTLSKAKTRADVARLVGYSEERARAGYAWVSSLIKRGHVSETIQEWTSGGKAIAEYHTTGSAPDYDYEEANRRKAKKRVGQKLRRWQDKVEAEQTPQAPKPQVYDERQIAGDTKVTPPIKIEITPPIKIEITRGDMTIKAEMDGYEQASKLITTILKGELV